MEAHPIKIFYCYAHEDDVLREQLARHLSPLRRLRDITGWFDRDIQAGAEWERESETQLDAANVILVLISADFMASDYCYTVEMMRALERHKAGTACVVPILLRPVEWEKTPLGVLSPLPTDRMPVTQWVNQDAAWLNIVQGINTIIRSLLPKQFLSSQDANLLYPEQGTLSGQTVGEKYILGELLGEGGFGAVYKAQHRHLQRLQAIKILLERHFQKSEFRERFLREAQTVAVLDHPNIIHLDDFGVDSSRAYLVMPFIRRGTLQNILQQQRHFLELKEISSYLEHICAALEYAHENGVVHLDLKPLNLLVRDDGGLLLADFGLAHLMKQGTVEGGSSLLVGSPHYMAPEHIQGHPEKRSDLFSLGVILYQMLIGRLPFEGSTPEAIISKNLTEWPTAPRLLRPDLPPAVEEVVGKALAKQPASRYQTASELFAAFKKAILASAQLPFAGSSYIVPEKPSVPYPAHNEEVSHQNYPVSNVGNPMGKTIVSYQEHREKVMSLAWSPDGRRIASAAQGIVQVWEPLSGRTIYTHKDKAFFPQYIYGVAWSPNSTHIVSGCADKTLQVWDANKGNLITTYKGHTKGISCVAWSPDGTRIVSGSVDKTAQVWNATSGQHILTFANHSGLLGILGVSAVAWSPDGRRITSCGNDSHVKVWNASDGSGIYSYDEHKGTIYGLAWSPDSSRIASCSHDLTIQVWVADTGSYRTVCRGHTQRVNTVAFSPDGRYLASACEDNTVRLWSSETGKNLFIYEGHTKNVHTLAWSPDGKYIASGGDDKIVQVWASGMS